MITKLLFTLLIIVVALITIRYRNSQRHHNTQQDREHRVRQAAERRHAWRVAVGLLTVMMLLSAGMYYSHWQERHRLVTVVVTNTLTGGVQSYSLYQADLDGRSFRTPDGRLIYLSDSERMEVREGRE